MIEIRHRRTGVLLKSVDAATLRGAHLTGAHLRCAGLSCADLSCADLTGAHLSGADLRCADLLQAIAPQIIAISGSRVAIITASPDRVFIGCLGGTLAEWLDQCTVIGERQGYTEAEIAEYKAHLEHIAKLFKMRGEGGQS